MQKISLAPAFGHVGGFAYDSRELHRGDCCNSLSYWLQMHGLMISFSVHSLVQASPHYSDFYVEIKECTTASSSFICVIYVQVEPGVQIFCRVFENYIKVANPNTANGHNVIEN